MTMEQNRLLLDNISIEWSFNCSWLLSWYDHC